MTANGEIVASMITSGKLSASIVEGGSLQGVSINIGNNNFTVSSTGSMTCTDATINGSIKSVNVANTKDVEITGGQIIGRNGQVIDMRNGVDYNKGVYIGADELDLDIGKLYISYNGDGNLYEPKSTTVSTLNGAGAVQYLVFKHGLFMGYS